MRTVALILGRRLFQAILVAVLVSTLCFFMTRFLPGDIAFRIGGGRYGYDLTTAQAVEAVRAELGLDRPLLAAWLSWMGDLVRLDLGVSFIYNRPVWGLVSEQLGNTLMLSAAAVGLSCLIGPPLGILAGLRPGGMVDRATLATAVFLRSMPPFVVGIIFVLVFAISLNWAPAAGHTSDGAIILPALTMAVGLAAVSSRVARSAMVDVAQSDYFEFALTKGLPLRQVAVAHGLRNIGVPLVTHLGMQLVYLVEGVVVVETLFAWPGVGHALTHAVLDRDVPMIQAAALSLALLFVLFNALVDMAALAIDPRLRGRS
jgi:peptide/nickel transport system permease protein